MSCRRQHVSVCPVSQPEPLLLGVKRRTYPQVAGAGEVFSVLMEGNCHDSVGGVERLLHAVPVMDVDVYVENSLVVPADRQTPFVARTRGGEMSGGWGVYTLTSGAPKWQEQCR